MWTDLGLTKKKGIGVHKLISTLKKNQKNKTCVEGIVIPSTKTLGCEAFHHTIMTSSSILPETMIYVTKPFQLFRLSSLMVNLAASDDRASSSSETLAVLMKSL